MRYCHETMRPSAECSHCNLEPKPAPPEVPSPDGWADAAESKAPEEVWVGVAPSGALMRVSNVPGFQRYEEGGGYAVVRYVRAREGGR